MSRKTGKEGDESEKKQEIMSRREQETRERRGRIGEKAGIHEQGPEENPGKKGTN